MKKNKNYNKLLKNYERKNFKPNKKIKKNNFKEKEIYKGFKIDSSLMIEKFN